MPITVFKKLFLALFLKKPQLHIWPHIRPFGYTDAIPEFCGYRFKKV